MTRPRILCPPTKVKHPCVLLVPSLLHPTDPSHFSFMALGANPSHILPLSTPRCHLLPPVSPRLWPSHRGAKCAPHRAGDAPACEKLTLNVHRAISGCRQQRGRARMSLLPASPGASWPGSFSLPMLGWHWPRVQGPDSPRAVARAVGMGIASAAAQEINPHLSARILSSLTCQIHRETVTKCLCANDAEF